MGRGATGGRQLRPAWSSPSGSELDECLRSTSVEAGSTADCVRQALARCTGPEPGAVSETVRERCVRDVHDELVALQAAQVAPPPSAEPATFLSPIPLWIVIGVTAGFLILVGGRIARRVRARNRAAFDAALIDLEAAGFRDAEAPALPPFASFEDHHVVRALVRRADDGDLWLLELDHAEGPQNERWPTRAALFGADLGGARGAIRPRDRKRAPVPGASPADCLVVHVHPASIGTLLLPLVGPELVGPWPPVAAELHSGTFGVITAPMPLRSTSEPLSLGDLADVADRIRAALRDRARAAGDG